MTNATKKEKFMEMLEIATELGRQDLVELCKHEIELLDKEVNKSEKENNDLMNSLFDNLLEMAGNGWF